MKKRGLIELHFNWIFILIAGAVILFFFVSIVNKQISLSELKTSGVIVTNLESILTGAQISTDTVNIVEMPKSDIGFECNRYFVGSAPKQTKGNVIFAPDLLKGKTLITWAQDWNMPYRVTNFLYITHPEVKYIIVNNAYDLGKKLFDALPDEINKELVDRTEVHDVKYTNNYRVRFVMFGNPAYPLPSDFTDVPDERISAINLPDLSGSSVIEPFGKIEFLKKDGGNWNKEGSSYYLKKESLFGAVFASDIEMYNCVMKKAFRKLELVSNIYLEKSKQLAEYYGTFGINDLNCANPHSQAVNYLQTAVDSAEERTQDFDTIGINEMNAMNDNANNIGGTPKSANNRAQLYSCALIY
jgi:hypothetical protein